MALGTILGEHFTFIVYVFYYINMAATCCFTRVKRRNFYLILTLQPSGEGGSETMHANCDTGCLSLYFLLLRFIHLLRQYGDGGSIHLSRMEDRREEWIFSFFLLQSEARRIRIIGTWKSTHRWISVLI